MERAGWRLTAVITHSLYGVLPPGPRDPFEKCGVSWSFPPDMEPSLAVGETVILLHPPLHLAGVSIATERERQQNDSLANG